MPARRCGSSCRSHGDLTVSWAACDLGWRQKRRMHVGRAALVRQTGTLPRRQGQQSKALCGKTFRPVKDPPGSYDFYLSNLFLSSRMPPYESTPNQTYLTPLRKRSLALTLVFRPGRKLKGATVAAGPERHSDNSRLWAAPLLSDSHQRHTKTEPPEGRWPRLWWRAV